MAVIKEINNQDTKYESIKDILQEKKYILPNFQRNYSWEKDQIDELFNSFLELFDSNYQNYQNYIGPIVLVSKDNQKKLYEVIDGQQRLITIILMLKSIEIILREKCAKDGIRYKERTENIKKWIHDLEDILIGKNDFPSFKKENNNDPVIVIRDNDNLALFGIIEAKNNEFIKSFKYKKNKIIKNYLYIYERLNKINEEISLIKPFGTKDEITIFQDLVSIILHRTYVLKTKFNDIGSAFKLFESINNTGLSLTAFDLVNGLINSEFDSKEDKNSKETQIEDHYRTVINDLKNENIPLESYLFYWINSFGKPVYKSDLYDKVKKEIQEKLYITVQDIADSFLKLYNYLEKSNLYSAKYIQLLNRKKIIPIFLILFKKEYSEKEIEKFMTDLVKYSILELNILQKSPGIFQYKIQEISEFILQNEKKFSFKELIQNEELKNIKSDYENYNSGMFEKWKENINRTDFNNMRSNFVKTILLMFLQKEEYLGIEINDIHAEHLFPQKPDIEWYKYPDWLDFKENKKEREKIINSIGNIILLESALNNKIKNKYITEKKNEIENLLNKSQILRNREWNNIDYDNFSPKKIKERTIKIIDLIDKRKIFLD